MDWDKICFSKEEKRGWLEISFLISLKYYLLNCEGVLKSQDPYGLITRVISIVKHLFQL